MKKLSVWVNEDEYKRFVSRAFIKKKSPYGLLKEIIRKELQCS